MTILIVFVDLILAVMSIIQIIIRLIFISFSPLLLLTKRKMTDQIDANLEGELE